jgi:anti-sigma B factor antagonist
VTKKNLSKGNGIASTTKAQRRFKEGERNHEGLNRTVDNVEIITLQGRSRSAPATQLREVITNAINSDKSNILLDLSGVTTIGSSGIGELVGSYTTVTNTAASQAPPPPGQLNELLHVTQLVPSRVYENEAEALRSF